MFKTKPGLALDLITSAVEDKIPGEIVLVDAAYGGSSEFRNTVRMYGSISAWPSGTIQGLAAGQYWAVAAATQSPRRSSVSRSGRAPSDDLPGASGQAVNSPRASPSVA